jgi:hypothetical protein
MGEILNEDVLAAIKQHERHCSSEVSALLSLHAKALTELQRGQEQMLNLLDHKVDDLINALKGKDMIPVSSLKWVIIYMLLFTFTVIVGKEFTADLANKFVAHQTAPVVAQ